MSTAPPPTAVQLPAVASVVELSNAFAAVADLVRPAVVFVRAESNGPHLARSDESARTSPYHPPMSGATASGTGVIVDATGYIVTNHHLVAQAGHVFVRLFDHREYEAVIVGVDPLTDIALLKIEAAGLPVASFGDSDRVRVGEWVLAVGHPLGQALMFTVTAGIVGATDRAVEPPPLRGRTTQEYIQTDAAANGGSSGGPLVDLQGRIVGMNAAIYSRSGFYQGYTLAIPASVVLPVLNQLRTRGHVTRSVLGVSAVEASSEDAAAVGLASVCGVVVQEIHHNAAPATLASLRPGDVILSVDGRRINSVAQLHRAVWFKPPGQEVEVTVQRSSGAEAVVALPVLASADAEARPHPTAAEQRAPPCSENRLGVCVVELDGRTAAYFGIPREFIGLMVRGVYAVGPSYGKLFADLDIVTHVEGRRIATADELHSALAVVPPGQIVEVRTYRFRSAERGFARVRVR